jgi:hypothetical protein
MLKGHLHVKFKSANLLYNFIVKLFVIFYWAILLCNFALQFCSAILLCNFALQFCLKIMPGNFAMKFHMLTLAVHYCSLLHSNLQK